MWVCGGCLRSNGDWWRTAQAERNDGFHRYSWQGTFIRIETQIGNKWEDSISTEIQKAGEEGKKASYRTKRFLSKMFLLLATVVVDGGWSERSDKHSYNAKSGVALIIGEKPRSYCIWAYEIISVLDVQ